MRHFVGYHNPDRMTYPADEADPSSLYTNKRLTDPVGDMVWVITGEGKSPKTYSLSCWFIIDNIVKDAGHPDFGLTLSGSVCGSFDPKPVLNGREWFPAFLKRMANFSVGLQEVSQADILDDFRSLADECGCPLPR